MLRRRKADVETELPERTDRNHFVPLSAEQQGRIRRRTKAGRRPPGQHRQAPPAHPAGAGQAPAPSRHDAHGLRHQLHPRPRRPHLPQAGANWRNSSRNAATTRRQGHRLLRMGADARTGARPVRPAATWALPGTPAACPQQAPPRRNQRLQVRPALPRLSQHRFRRDRPEPAKRQRGHQLRPALESGQAGAAHRPRLAQTPDPPRHRHQPDFRKHHRAPDARNALQQAGAGRWRARPQGQPEGNQAAQRTAGLPVQAQPIGRPARGGCQIRRAGS